MVFEDLQWADETTRDAFAILTATRMLPGTVIVGTYRSDEMHRRHPLRGVLSEPGDVVDACVAASA